MDLAGGWSAAGYRTDDCAGLIASDLEARAIAQGSGPARGAGRAQQGSLTAGHIRGRRPAVAEDSD